MRTQRVNDFMVPRSRLVAAVAACAVAIGLPLLASIPAGASARHPPAAGTGAAKALAAAAGHGNPGLAVLEERAALHERAAMLAHSAAITGVVVGPDGLPVEGACVAAVGGARSTISTAGRSGRFDITGLAPGSYVLAYRDCSAPGRYLTVWSGGTMSQQTAEHVRISTGQVSHVPAMMLRPANPANLLPDSPAWRRMVAASSASLTPAAAAKTGKITGTVTGKGKPLHGICVRAFSASQRGAPNYGTTTRRNGTYLMRNVRPGRYFVVFAGNCPSAGNWLQQWYRGHNTPLGINANTVKITAGRTRHINARLTLGGEISGRVTKKSGKGLRGICVLAAGFLPEAPDLRFTSTGKNGTYRLPALFHGNYAVNFLTGCNNNGNYAPSPSLMVLIRNDRHHTLNVRLAVGATVTGTVRLGSRTGPKLKGICVAAYNETGGFASSQGATGARGRYRVVGLDTGRVELSFFPGCNNNGNFLESNVSAHATQGKVKSGVDAVLQPGAAIRGKVTNTSGTGLGGMCMNFTGPLPDILYVTTNPNGSYDIRYLPAGSYELGFSSGCSNSLNYAPYWYDNTDDQSLATPIVVAKASSHVINARMQTGGEITGTVTNTSGKKLTGICVGATTQFAAPFEGYDTFASTNHGRFRITGLEPGQYLVDVGCGQSGSYGDQWFRNAASAGDAELVSVTPGRTSDISAVLRAGGTIHGVVTGPSGRPLAGICVQAFSTKVRGQALVVTGGPDVPVTGSRGAYTLTGLAAGTYDVEFYPCTGNARFAAQWYRRQTTQRRATPVRVRAGVIKKGVDARLAIGGSVSGHVVGASGKPLGDICVFAYNPVNGLLSLFPAITGNAGRYSVPGLGMGSYTVEFTPCNQPVNLVTAFDHVRVSAPKAVTGVDARLVRGGSVSGVITTAGHPAIGVSFECAEVESASPDNAGGVGFSAVGGGYLATGIAPGTYKVFFGDQYCGEGAPDLAPQWYNDQPSEAGANTITVKADYTTKGIDAALQTDGVITGTVRGPAGKPVTGACVTAYPTLAGSFPIVAVTRPGGSYSLIDLLPGKYRVEFSSGCGATGYRNQWWQKASSRRTATVIDVTTGQVVTKISAKLVR